MSTNSTQQPFTSSRQLINWPVRPLLVDEATSIGLPNQDPDSDARASFYKSTDGSTIRMTTQHIGANDFTKNADGSVTLKFLKPVEGQSWRHEPVTRTFTAGDIKKTDLCSMHVTDEGVDGLITGFVDNEHGTGYVRLTGGPSAWH